MRVLDPACGSGNFLYVTLDVLKRLESEVVRVLEDLGERQTLLALHDQSVTVSPKNFLGIEVKPWAKEIAELVLWIGYLQWHYRTWGKQTPPPEPVLRDYKNIERRDAVLAWDGELTLISRSSNASLPSTPSAPPRRSAASFAGCDPSSRIRTRNREPLRSR